MTKNQIDKICNAVYEEQALAFSEKLREEFSAIDSAGEGMSRPVIYSRIALTLLEYSSKITAESVYRVLQQNP